MPFMSDIRREFYDAVNESNKPKAKKIVSKPVEKKITPIEEQIAKIIAESNSAIIDMTVTVDNMPLVEWLYEMTKRDQEELDIEKIVNEELEKINKLREEARREYRQRNKMLEAIAPASAAAASSSAAAGAAGAGAGAGAGGSSIIIRLTRNGYVVDDYVEDYLK